jgi:hypothetical protein
MVDLNPSELKKDNNLILKHDCLFISIRDRYAEEEEIYWRRQKYNIR